MEFRDPLSFGQENEDLDDLTEQLGNALLAEPSGGSYTLGGEPGGPLHGGSGAPAGSSGAAPAAGQGAAGAADPFVSLAAVGKQEGEQPYTTYGALVTPAAPPPQQQQQPDEQHEHAALAAAAAAAAAGAAAAGAAGVAAAAAPPPPYPGGPSSSSGGASVAAPGGLSPPAAAAAAGSEPGGSADSIASPRMPPESAPPQLPLAITVSEPLKKEAAGVLGMKASHIEYLVTTRSSLPGWSAPEVVVRRRFRDFVALAELLKAQFRGFFVPPRPEKNAVEGSRMSDAFVEERRAGLQRYLMRLAAHPAIGPSEALRVFLETPGELGSSHRWTGLLPASASLIEGTTKFSLQLLGRESRVVDPVAAAQPAARSKDLMRAMKEAAQGIGMRGGREVPLEELDLRRLREGAEEMREQLGTTSRAAEKLVGKLDQLGATLGDLGLSLFKVAKFEEAEGGPLAAHTGTLRYSSGLIADQKRSAAALVRASKMMAKVTARVALELGTLHDNLAAMPAAIRGYMSREHQMLTWHTLAADLEAKQKALAELDKTKVKRADELRNDIACLELSVGAAKAEYDKIKAANVAETGRFAAERRAEYGAMLENFTATQVAAAERMAEVWVQLAAELGAGPEQLAQVRVSGGAGAGLLGTAPQP